MEAADEERVEDLRESSFVSARCVALAVLAAAGLAVLLLAGCSKSDPAPQSGLPSWADQAAVTAQAREVVEEAVARDWPALAERFADGGVTPEQLDKSLSETFDSLGGMQEYADATYLQGESKGRSYATILQDVKFQNGEGEFRISFFEDGSLAGFYFVKEQA